MLVALGLAGVGGLVRLTWNLLTPKRYPSVGIHRRQEVISIWLQPALFDLAHDLSAAAAPQSREAFRRYAKDRGLEKSFYLVTVRSIQTDGGVVLLSTIREPYSMTDDSFWESVDVMATAAGRPPHYATIDFSTAKVSVIPDRLAFGNWPRRGGQIAQSQNWRVGLVWTMLSLLAAALFLWNRQKAAGTLMPVRKNRMITFCAA